MGLLSSSKSTKKTTVNNTSTTQAAQDEAINLNNSRITTEIVNADPASVINSTNAYLNDSFSTVLGFVEKQNQTVLESLGADTEQQSEKLKAFMPFAIIGTIAFIGYKVVTR